MTPTLEMTSMWETQVTPIDKERSQCLTLQIMSTRLKKYKIPQIKITFHLRDI